MSRARKNVRRAQPQTPHRAPARTRLWTRALIVVVALALGVLGAWMIWRPEKHPANPDPVAALAPGDAFQRAIELSYQKHFRESLPFYRHALGHASPDFSDLHFNYALALYDLSVQYEDRGGRLAPATRSSVERVELAREALSELDRAAQLAPSRAALATVLSYRANMLCLWGFPWDALQSYRGAQRADSTNRALAERADRFVMVMRDPSLLTLTGSDPASPTPPR